jgi:hypothetical protein
MIMGLMKHDDDHGHKKWYKKYKVDAKNDYYKGDEDTTISGNLLSNDKHSKGYDLDIKYYTQPKHGTVTVDKVTGEFKYTPNKDFYGNDYFKYKVVDKYGKTDWAKVKLCVKDVAEPVQPVAPVAEDDKYYVKEKGKLYGNVSLNDTDADGTLDGDAVDLTFKVLTGPSEGKLYLNEDTGAFCFKPGKDKDWKDEKVTFTYQVTDEQGLTDTATVTICVDDNWGKKHYYEKPHYDAMA